MSETKETRKYLVDAVAVLVAMALLAFAALRTQGNRQVSQDALSLLTVDLDWERDVPPTPPAQGSPGAAMVRLLELAARDRWQDVYGAVLPEVRQQVSAANLKLQLEPLLAHVTRFAVLRQEYQNPNQASVTLALGTVQPGKALLLVADSRRSDGVWYLGYSIAPVPEGLDKLLTRPGDMTLKSEHFLITHAGNGVLARQTATVLEGSYTVLTQVFEVSPAPVHVYLAPDRASFDWYLSGRQPDWAIGFAAMGRIFLLDPQVWTRNDPATFPMVVKHEFVHFLVDEATKGGGIPQWFKEGLAYYLAGQGRPMEHLRRAANANQLPRLEDLFADLSELSPYAYPLSWAAVLFIEASFGEGTSIRMVAEVGKGRPWSEVLKNATGMDEKALDEAVTQYLRGQ